MRKYKIIKTVLIIEYQIDNKLAAKHVVEEAMTRAFVRKCNKCSRVFLKEDGCNKITCECGNKQCYVCGTDVADYKHFAQPGDTTKCPLQGEMHELLHHQVAVAQEKTVQELLKHRTELQDDDIRVDKRTDTDTVNLSFPSLELPQNNAAPLPDVTLLPPVDRLPFRNELVRHGGYICRRCYTDFDTANALSQHRTAKHQPAKRLNECWDCRRTFGSGMSLSQHLRDKHGKYRRWI
jgi:hypothetical protein